MMEPHYDETYFIHISFAFLKNCKKVHNLDMF